MIRSLQTFVRELRDPYLVASVVIFLVSGFLIGLMF